MARKGKTTTEVTIIGITQSPGIAAGTAVFHSLKVVEPGTNVRISYDNHDEGHVPLHLNRNIKGDGIFVSAFIAGFLHVAVGSKVTLTA